MCLRPHSTRVEVKPQLRDKKELRRTVGVESDTLKLETQGGVEGRPFKRQAGRQQ